MLCWRVNKKGIDQVTGSPMTTCSYYWACLEKGIWYGVYPKVLIIGKTGPPGRFSTNLS